MTTNEQQAPAASTARAVLSVTHDDRTEEWVAACSRCAWRLGLTDRATDKAGMAAMWLGSIADHEEEHAPARGPGVLVTRDVQDTGDGFYAVVHDLGPLQAVEFVDQHGVRRTVPRGAGGWDDLDDGVGAVEFHVPVADVTPLEVWLHAKAAP